MFTSQDVSDTANDYLGEEIEILYEQLAVLQREIFKVISRKWGATLSPEESKKLSALQQKSEAYCAKITELLKNGTQ